MAGCCVAEKHAQSMLQLLHLVYAVRTWKPGRLEQIVDSPVPQTEEEIAEVSQLVPQERVQQLTSTSRPSLCGTAFGTFDFRKSRCFRHELVRDMPFDCVVRVMCLPKHSPNAIDAHFDAPARMFSVVSCVDPSCAQTIHIDSRVPSKSRIIRSNVPHHEVVSLNSAGHQSCH